MVSAAVAVAIAAALFAAASPAAAQTPAPTIEPRGACPAEVDLVFDVSSVAGAVDTRYRVQAGGVNVANVRLRNQTSGRVALDLRSFDRPLLDGVAWTAQVRALAADGSAVAAFSTAAGIPNPDTTPEEAEFSLVAGSGNAIALTWELAGALEACADRVRWELKSSPFASATEADPAATTGVATGASDSATLTVPGPGTYHVRLLALHGGEAATDAIGRWSSAEQATVAAVARAQALRVRVVDVELARCTRGDAPREGAEVALRAAGASGSRAQTAKTDSDGIATFEVESGAAYELGARLVGKLGECASETVRVEPSARDVVELALVGCVSDDGDRAVLFANEPPRVTVGGPTWTVLVTNRGSGLVAPAGSVVVELESPVPGGSPAPATRAATGPPLTAAPTRGAPSRPVGTGVLLRESFGPVCRGEELSYSVSSPGSLVARLEPPRADAVPSNDLARQAAAGTTTRPDDATPTEPGHVAAPRLRFIGVWRPTTTTSGQLRFIGVWQPRTVASSQLRFIGIWQPVTITTSELRFIGAGSP